MTYRYEELAKKYMKVGVRTGQEWMVFCPFHDNTGTPAMQFNVEKGLFVCFGCGATGNARMLLKHYGATWIEGEVDVKTIRDKLKELDEQAGRATEQVLPETWLKRYDLPTRYWESRGFTQKTIKAFDLGYDPIEDVATIPLRNVQGGLLGVIKRYLDPDEDIKYKYPKGFSRTSHMFGEWLVAVDDRSEVCIVEGSVDAMKVWQAGIPCLAQYGSSINPRQIRLMLRMGIQSVVLFYDNDVAGKKAVRQAQGLTMHRRGGKFTEGYNPQTDLRRFFQVRKVNYTPDMHSDPGACNGNQIKRAFAKSSELP